MAATIDETSRPKEPPIMTRLLLLLALLLPTSAAAKTVLIKPSPGVGDSYSISVTNRVDATMSVTEEGATDTFPLFNEDVFQMQVTVKAVEGAAITSETFMIEDAVRRAVMPGKTVPSVAWRGNGGSNITVIRDANGKVSEASTDPEGEIPEEMVEEITPVRPRTRDFGIDGQLEVGKTIEYTTDHFLGNKGKATGTTKLVKVVSRDGIDVAVLEVAMVAVNPAEGGQVEADIKGTVEFSLNSGQCILVNLNGTIKITAKMDGTAVSGSGTLLIQATMSDG